MHQARLPALAAALLLGAIAEPAAACTCMAFPDDPADRLTLTCVPWGSGMRVGLDRDEDGVLNGDE